MKRLMSEGGNKKVKMKVAVLLLAAMCLFALATPVMAEEISVTRSFSTTSPSPNSEFDVMLTIYCLNIGGIVETLPDGFTYVSTTYPSDQVSVSGQKIAFAVINEKEIRYRVKAPSSGSGMFTGIWEDLLSGTDGTIKYNSVSVVEPPTIVVELSTELPEITVPVTVVMPTPTPTPTATPAPTATPTPTPVTEFHTPPSTPGFEVASTIVALLAVCLLAFRGKGGNER
ncbi:MAG: PGF-CTERM sorting domain-containing protein [Methanocellales archaeon]|nr:PGF-CTERM sorting domain-containing protein [Methanocellales archaeon]